MLETLTTLLSSLLIIALLRRWLVAAQAGQQTVPTVFASWLTSTATFAQYGCDYLAWATSLYNGGNFSVSLMFRK
jgi:hypothetical protein